MLSFVGIKAQEVLSLKQFCSPIPSLILVVWLPENVFFWVKNSTGDAFGALKRLFLVLGEDPVIQLNLPDRLGKRKTVMGESFL